LLAFALEFVLLEEIFQIKENYCANKHVT